MNKGIPPHYINHSRPAQRRSVQEDPKARRNLVFARATATPCTTAERAASPAPASITNGHPPSNKQGSVQR